MTDPFASTPIYRVASSCLKIFIIGFALMSNNTAMASEDKVYQRFEFDLRRDGQHAVLLEYQYYAGTLLITAGDPYYTKAGTGFVFESAGLRAPRGTSLHAKWRDTASNEVFEDTVDMNKLLPQNMEGQTIVLMIDGRQLKIFLISQNVPHEAGTPVVGPSGYRQFAARQLYP